MTNLTSERRSFPRRKKNVGPPIGEAERRRCEDRRHDLPSRERIENLEVRYRRVTELLFASMVVTLIVCTLGLILISQQASRIQDAQVSFKAETRERVNQTCRILEGKQRDTVDQLKQTYTYLLGLSPAEKRSPLNRAVLANVPKLERDARVNDAPAYCNDPGVGLPEPDPEPPARPAQLRAP
jgi:hypothetical protein